MSSWPTIPGTFLLIQTEQSCLDSKEIESKHAGKEEVKLFYTSKWQDCQCRKFYGVHQKVAVINEFIIVVGNNVDIQKLVIFLYTSSEQFKNYNIIYNNIKK